MNWRDNLIIPWRWRARYALLPGSAAPFHFIFTSMISLKSGLSFPAR
jgi:hypothetical protein